MSKKKITGKKRPARTPPSLLDTDWTPQRWKLEDAIERMELLDALLDHYKIDLEGPDKWMMLSLRLAMDHVPDFQREKAPRGRPATYRDPLAAALVERARFTQRTDISGAIRYVIETEPNFKFVTESALRKRWQRGLSSPWVELAKAGVGSDWPWALVPVLKKLEESSRKRGQKS